MRALRLLLLLLSDIAIGVVVAVVVIVIVVVDVVVVVVVGVGVASSLFVMEEVSAVDWACGKGWLLTWLVARPDSSGGNGHCNCI